MQFLFSTEWLQYIKSFQLLKFIKELKIWSWWTTYVTAQFVHVLLQNDNKSFFQKNVHNVEQSEKR